MRAEEIAPYRSTSGTIIQAPIINDAAWKELQRRIWQNHFNRDHHLTDSEIRYMPWIAQMRPPASWQEFLEGVRLLLRERPGYGIYQRQYKFAYLTAKAYGVTVLCSGDWRIYQEPGCPDLCLYKEEDAGQRVAILRDSMAIAGR